MRIAGIALLVIAFLGILVYAMKEHGKWEEWCRTQGGRVTSHTDHVTTWRNGTPETGSNTTYFCLSNDGRILDIR